MNRRHFLKRAGAGITGYLFATGMTAGLVAGAYQDLSLKKAVKFGMVEEDLSIAEKFQLLKDLGFDG
ncbi:MAG TPA: sugar phosphate isomerase/epimerase, partial [bacterium]|nr:sugar phosphate isomerase/epimerase [bacterium]